MAPKELKINKATPEIIGFFDRYGQKVFSETELNGILLEHSTKWQLPQDITTYKFIKYLHENTKLQITKISFPQRNVIRYSWGTASVYDFALSLRTGSYFTHYTAMYLHQLTEQVPKTIYTNFEQTPKYSDERELKQDRIDAAFKRPPRISNTIASLKDYRICLLNGMHTERLGVIETIGPDDVKIQLTNTERTLIDIAVRPAYSGGVFEVLKAYRLAMQKVSIDKLAAMLKELNYIYPYHQAIGFYLEKAGYSDLQIGLFRELPMNFNFYLTHQMKEKHYSQEWRLYYPKGF